MPEWLHRNLGWIRGVAALIAWVALLYFMFWDVL